MEGQAVSTAYMPKAKTVEYTTPIDLFDALNDEFGPFTLDPAAMPGQYTAEAIIENGGMAYCPPEVTAPTTSWREDGLLQSWHGRVFLNPPYGREMPKWIGLAVREIEAGNVELVCALIPSRTDTKMWQKYILKQTGPFRGVNYCVDAHATIDLVRFLPGRIKFGGANDPAPFPSAVVVWTSPDYSEDEG